MKRFFFISIYSLCLLACQNEVPINGTYKSMGVLYGLLDPKLDTQFVRIGRGYLAEGDIYSSTSISDSIYYKNLDVTLYECIENGDTLRSTQLLADPSMRKLSDNGPFTTEGFAIFRTDGTFRLKPGLIYHLRAAVNDGRTPDILAQTQTIKAIDEKEPFDGLLSLTEPSVILFQGPGNLIYFNDIIEWEENTAFSYKTKVTQFYKEIDTTTKTEQVLHYTLLHDYVVKDADTYRIKDFQEAMALYVKPKPNVIRFLGKLEVEVICVDGTLDSYMQFQSRNTSNQFGIYNFTNVKNGLGIFASRTTTRLEPVFFSRANEARIVKLNQLCPLNFAIPKANGDTVICIAGPDGVGIEKVVRLK
jgi:hypothetical protein